MKKGRTDMEQNPIFPIVIAVDASGI